MLYKIWWIGIQILKPVLVEYYVSKIIFFTVSLKNKLKMIYFHQKKALKQFAPIKLKSWVVHLQSPCNFGADMSLTIWEKLSQPNVCNFRT